MFALIAMMFLLLSFKPSAKHEIEVLCEDPKGQSYITINNDTGVITYWRDLGWWWGHEPEEIGIQTAMTICLNDWSQNVD